jgi:hypothetical protein
MEPQKILNQTAVITAACYCNIMNNLTPTLILSNSFNFTVQTSQSPETNTNLAIRPKLIISQMFVLIPVINERNDM